MTMREAYVMAKKQLKEAGKSSFDAGCLLEKHFQAKREDLPFRGGEELSVTHYTGFMQDVARRIAGEPLQYLLGKWEFMGLPFFVGSGVLIPRPETEMLAETAIAFLTEQKGPTKVLDLCAGSGCLAISVAHFSHCPTVGLELSAQAFRYFQQNIVLNGLKKQVRPLQGSLFAAPSSLLGPDFVGSFTVLLSNPPYIRTEELPTLQKEVQKEPVLALDGGTDGLRFYRALCTWLPALQKGGLFACEIGQGQGEGVAKMVKAAGLQEVQIHLDFAGIDRMVTGRRK